MSDWKPESQWQHRMLDEAKTVAIVGLPQVMSSLKTLFETGHPLEASPS